MSKDELLDLVDIHDEVIGQIWRSESNRLATSKEGYLRAATALIQDSAGRLWIPRRVKDKQIAPLGLDSSMQEHVGANETYEEAVVRGFAEELNITLTLDDLEYIGKLPPTENLYYFVTLFIYKSDETPTYNPADFIEAMWIKPDELIKLLEAGEVAKKSLLSTAKLLQEAQR